MSFNRYSLFRHVLLRFTRPPIDRLMKDAQHSFNGCGLWSASGASVCIKYRPTITPRAWPVLLTLAPPPTTHQLIIVSPSNGNFNVHIYGWPGICGSGGKTVYLSFAINSPITLSLLLGRVLTALSDSSGISLCVAAIHLPYRRDDAIVGHDFHNWTHHLPLAWRYNCHPHVSVPQLKRLQQECPSENVLVTHLCGSKDDDVGRAAGLANFGAKTIFY